MRIWYDVTTIFNCRGQATGIPRVVTKILEALTAHPEVQLRLCMFDKSRNRFLRVTHKPSRLDKCLALVNGCLARAVRPCLGLGRLFWHPCQAVHAFLQRRMERFKVSSANRQWPRLLWRGVLRPVICLPLTMLAFLSNLRRGILNPWLPSITARPLFMPFCLLVHNLLKTGRDLWPGALLLRAYYTFGWFPLNICEGLLVRCSSKNVQFSSGDILLDVGAPWLAAGRWQVLASFKEQQGFACVSMIHDLIPHLFPHYCPDGFGATFRLTTLQQLQVCDLVLVYSESTRRDLVAFAKDQAVACPPLQVTQLGSELASLPSSQVSLRFPGLEIADRFVLTVSTIDVRKNHRLLYQVWRRLSERFGAATPKLVIVGRPGRLSADLITEMRTDPLVKNLIVLGFDVSDRQLDLLYRQCLFTIYPSFYEGWGLPIAESLYHGKFCIASNSSSMPEIGGKLLDYFDPLDFATCYRQVCRAIFEEDYLASREEGCRRDYRPTTWKECVAGLVQALLPHGPSAWASTVQASPQKSGAADRGATIRRAA